MNRIALALTLTAAIGLTACKGAKEDEAGGPTAAVQTVPASERELAQTVTGYGQVEFAPGHALSLVVQVESQVVAVLTAPGAQVQAGTPLLQLRPSAQTALDVDRATREAALAAGEEQRLQRLREEGLATDAEAAAARTQAATLAQLRDSLSARSGGGQDYLLRAPRDGIVDVLTAQPGDLLAAGATAVRLGDPHALQAHVGLEPDDAAQVVAGAVAHVSVPQAAVEPVSGRVTAVERRLDKDTRLAAAYVALPPTSTLMVGVQVEGRVVVAVHRGVAVPVAPLVHAEDGLVVYVVAEQKAHRQVVTVGIDDGAYVELLSGVAAGAQVVTTGNHELKDGMTVRPVGETPARAQKDAP